MGYTNVTDLCMFIPPSVVYKTAGTWTPTVASDVIADVRTAADATFNLWFPIIGLPSSVSGRLGAKLTSIEVHYRIATAVLDAVDPVTLNRHRFRTPGQIPQADLIDITLDADHDTSDKRRAVLHHQMIVTVDTPIFMEKGHTYYLVIACDGSLNGVMTLHGAIAHYTLRQ